MFTAFESYKNELEGVTSSVKPNENQGTTDDPTHTTSANKDKVVFRVQIETSDKRITATSPKFKGLKVFEYEQDNLFKYTAGEYVMDFKSANGYKTELREQGFQHAFVVAFLNGERINLEKAIKLAEK